VFERRFSEDLTGPLGPVHIEAVLDLPNPSPSHHSREAFRPARLAAKVGIGAVRDLTRTQSELLAENALLRQQVIMLRRSIRRPRCHPDDRLFLLILARLCHRWRNALHVVKPETLLRWHRDFLKIVWRRKSRPRGQPRRLAREIVMLIRTMAKRDVLWGAERIRGELLKLGIRVSKRTIQKYMKDMRPRRKRGQTLGHVYRQSQPRYLGVRPLTALQRSLSPYLRILLRGPRDAGSRSFQCDSLSHRPLGRPAAPGGHAILPGAEVSHSGQR